MLITSARTKGSHNSYGDGGPEAADWQHELRGPLVRQAHHKLSDVPGYADKLEGEDRDVLKLRPGITGPATLKARANERRATSWLDCYPECSRDSTKSNIVWRTR